MTSSGRPTASRPVVVAVAITGSLPSKADNPAVPITVAEQVESTRQAFEAGATLVHIHVRGDDGLPSSDPARFAAVRDGVAAQCPGMIVQFSTGGRGRDPSLRGSSLAHIPDMASLSTGSVNFPTIVYENPTRLVEELAGAMRNVGTLPEIEVFDLSHLHAARRLADAGLIGEAPHIQFVMGVANATPAIERLLDVFVAEMELLFPAATWTAAGIGRHQADVMGWALDRGADAVRTGLEDNVRLSRHVLADSNAQLVALACDAIRARGRRPAGVAEARSILGLPSSLAERRRCAPRPSMAGAVA